jgi:predicted Zn-dependent peptidase
MEQTVYSETFANGLTLLFEPMPWLQSVAFTLLVRSGNCHEPESRLGLAGVCLEMVQRGAGPRDSREIVEALDFLGVERSSSISTFHSIFSTAMIRTALEETLSIYADIVQRPSLLDDDLDDARQVALQELLAIKDDLAHRCLTELKRIRFQQPYGRSAYGSEEGIEAITIDDVQKQFGNRFHASGSILSVAGNYDWNDLRKLVQKLFGSWSTKSFETEPDLRVSSTVGHIAEDSAQNYIALAYDCVPYQHPDYYESRGLIGVLSDGMSSRLFTEVREKRGLVYGISASCQSLKDRGSVFCYAGTTNGRAEETLQVTLETIQSLGDGVTEDELARLKSRIKTSLVLEQESCMSRSSQIASDWYYLGRVPSRQEVAARVERLSCQSLLNHFNENPPKNWTLVTLGHEKLELPSAI